MQRLEVSGAVRPIYGSLGVKRLIVRFKFQLAINRLVMVGTRCKLGWCVSGDVTPSEWTDTSDVRIKETNAAVPSEKLAPPS